MFLSLFKAFFMLRDVDFERSIENKNCKHGLNSMDLQQLTLDFQNYVASIKQADSTVFVTVRVPKCLTAETKFCYSPGVGIGFDDRCNDEK